MASTLLRWFGLKRRKKKKNDRADFGGATGHLSLPSTPHLISLRQQSKRNRSQTTEAVHQTDDRKQRGVSFRQRFLSSKGYTNSGAENTGASSLPRQQQTPAPTPRLVKKVAAPSVPDVTPTMRSRAHVNRSGVSATPRSPWNRHDSSRMELSPSQPQCSPGSNHSHPVPFYSLRTLQHPPQSGSKVAPLPAHTHQLHQRMLPKIVESPQHRLSSVSDDASQTSIGKSASSVPVTSLSASSGIGSSLNSAASSSSNSTNNGCGHDGGASRHSVLSSSTGGGGVGTAGGGGGDCSLADSLLDDAMDDDGFLHQQQRGAGGSEIGLAVENGQIDVQRMRLNGVQDSDILRVWLSSFGQEDYLPLLSAHGYDLTTVSRMTPEDLTGVGIARPEDRRRMTAEIRRLQHVADGWPTRVTGGIRDWLECLRMDEYFSLFEQQGYKTVKQVMQLSWEDFEEIGIVKLGHLKKLGLAIKKLKEHRRTKDSIPDRTIHLENASDTLPSSVNRRIVGAKLCNHSSPIPHNDVCSHYRDSPRPQHNLINPVKTFTTTILPSEHYGTFPRRSPPQQTRARRLVVTAEVYANTNQPQLSNSVRSEQSSLRTPYVSTPRTPTHDYTAPTQQGRTNGVRLHTRTTALLDDSDEDTSNVISSPTSPSRSAGITPLNLHSPGRMLERSGMAKGGPTSSTPNVPSPAPRRMLPLLLDMSPAPSLDEDDFPPPSPPSPVLCDGSIPSLGAVRWEEDGRRRTTGDRMSSSLHAAPSAARADDMVTSGRTVVDTPSTQYCSTSAVNALFCNSRPAFTSTPFMSHSARTPSRTADAACVQSIRRTRFLGTGASTMPSRASKAVPQLDDIGSMLQNLTDELDALICDPATRQRNYTAKPAAAAFL